MSVTENNFGRMLGLAAMELGEGGQFDQIIIYAHVDGGSPEDDHIVTYAPKGQAADIGLTALRRISHIILSDGGAKDGR